MSVAWFVDGSYAYKNWRNAAGLLNLDYNRFRAAIEDDSGEPVTDAYYFNANNDPPNAKQHKFHAAIGKRPPEGPGLRVYLGSLQHKRLWWKESLGGGPVMHPDFPEEQYELISQKEVDVLLAYYLTLSYQARGWKRLYLVAGDRDFLEPVKRLVIDRGVDLTIFGVRGGTSALNGKRYNPSISEVYNPLGRAIYFEDVVDSLAMDPRAQPPRDYAATTNFYEGPSGEDAQA